MGVGDGGMYVFYPNQQCDDVACPPFIAGCTDDTACNYDDAAEVNDGSCEYPDEGFDCAGNALGACCDGTACFQQSQTNCEAAGFIWMGAGVSCTPNPCVDGPDNDDCANAIEIFCGTEIVAYSTNSTTSEIAPPIICDDPIGNDVWYRFESTADGEVTISTCGDDTDFNTIIAVYDAPAGCNTLNSVICNDDGCDLQSTVVFDALLGTDYYIQIGGWNGATGTFRLDADCESGCTDVDACNHDETAYEDDGSCTYPEDGLDCDGDCWQQVVGTPVDITSLRFTQRNWHLENEILENTSWGRVHLGYLPGGETHFVNIVAQDVSQEDVWLVQNWPLFYVDNDDYDERFKAVDFNIEELGYEDGDDCNEISYSITITPDQFTDPSPVDEWNTCPVLPLEYRVLPFDPESLPVPFEPGVPVGCKGAGEPEPLSGDRTIKPVQEDDRMCFPGSMARSIDWLNRKHDLGSDKTPQQIYDDLRDAGVGDDQADVFDAPTWIKKKRDYARTLTDNKIITTVWDGNGVLPEIEGVEEETGNFLEWIIQELKRGHDVEVWWKHPRGAHIVTAVRIYKKGSKYFLVYRDDEKQGDDDEGDKEEKEAEIWFEDGHYRIVASSKQIFAAVSERPDVNQNNVPDAYEYDNLYWYCSYEESQGGDLLWDECGVCGGDGTTCGCTYPQACNYDAVADVDDGSCIFAEDCETCDGDGGIATNDLDQDGVCDEDEVPGCTDPVYLNFNPLATDEDGSCSSPVVEGCTWECASNYDPSANVDDGSCDTTTTGSGGCGTVDCPDLDCDGVVSVNDILALLAGFGQECSSVAMPPSTNDGE